MTAQVAVPARITRRRQVCVPDDRPGRGSLTHRAPCQRPGM